VGRRGQEFSRHGTGRYPRRLGPEAASGPDQLSLDHFDVFSWESESYEFVFDATSVVSLEEDEPLF